jgi:hypothetical protein
VRSKVEYAIGVIKRAFGFQQVRYRGLAENLHRLGLTAALAAVFGGRVVLRLLFAPPFSPVVQIFPSVQ